MSLAPRAAEVETHLAPCWTFIMIDLYQMASLAGISGSWLTDGEMLWLRPLSSPSREKERALNGDRAGGEWLRQCNGKGMGMKAGGNGGERCRGRG